MTKEKYPHFRYYKKSRHPALILGERKQKKKDEYQYRKVMHGEYDGDKLNEMVYPNPNSFDSRPMYIAKRKRYDEKKFFSSWKYPWKYRNKKK